MIDPQLRQILVCPADRGALVDDEAARRLECTVCGRRYPVTDGIPVMLVDQADEPADS